MASCPSHAWDTPREASGKEFGSRLPRTQAAGTEVARCAPSWAAALRCGEETQLGLLGFLLGFVF